jgi:hypothetical protein
VPNPPGFGGFNPHINPAANPHLNPAAHNPLLGGGAEPRPGFEGFGVLAPTALTPFKRKLEPQMGERVYGWPPGFQGLGDPRLLKRRGADAGAVGNQPEKPRGVQYPYKVREHVLIKVG